MQRSIKYGLYGAVLASIVSGPIAWSSVDQTVRLVVDGTARSITTNASDVAGVLHAAGYAAGPHDLLAPEAAAAVHDGSRIILRRGRLLHLSINGHTTNVWTTASTVRDALGQLGYSEANFISVSRSERLPLTPTSISVQSPMLLTVIHDGQKQTVTTTANTVGQLFDDMGITLAPLDRVSSPVSAALWNDETLRLTRVRKTSVTQMVKVPFATKRVNDSAMVSGRTQIVTAGKMGSAMVTYVLVYVDGKIAGRTKVASVTLTQAQAQVEKVGTKPATVAYSGPAPSPGSAQAYAKSILGNYGWSSDQFGCLDTLWSYESGWNVHAANASGAYGIPQALPGSKMGSAGPDWQNNFQTQVKWGLGYIKGRYGSPCSAWSFWQNNHWY